VRSANVDFAGKTMCEMLTEEDLRGLMERVEDLKMSELFEEPCRFMDDEKEE